MLLSLLNLLLMGLDAELALVLGDVVAEIVCCI